MGISVESISTNPEVFWAKEHATDNSFVAGDLIQFDPNGKVQLGVTTEWGTTHTAAGIARRPATGSENGDIEVEMIQFDRLYAVRIDSTTTHARALVGDWGDWVYTAGAGYLNLQANTTWEMVVVALDGRDAEGTTSGRVLVRFRSSLLEFAVDRA